MIRDVIDIWCVIDVQKGGKTVSTFVVDDPKTLPAVDNNSQNFYHLFTLISHLQKQITDIGNIVTRIDKNTEVTNLDPTFASTISVFVSADSSMDTGARNSRYLIVKSQTEAELISIDVYPVKTKERGRFSPYTTGGANYKNFHANIAYGNGVVIIVISSSVFAGSQGFSFSIPFRVRRSVTSGTSS